MKLKLENIESKRTQELVNLIRSYNKSNREPSKSEPLNIYLEDEEIEAVSIHLLILLIFKHQNFMKNMVIKKYLP